jgi:hypothetical protein
VLAAVGDVRGAQLESKGGFVETSGDQLKTDGISVSAKDWLLDPSDITISNSASSNVTGATAGYLLKLKKIRYIPPPDDLMHALTKMPATEEAYEMLMEQFMEMKSMIANLQSEIESLKNPVDDFLTKWMFTFEAMRMLRVSRRTIDNYIKAGKLTPVRISKRNHFAIAQV